MGIRAAFCFCVIPVPYGDRLQQESIVTVIPAEAGIHYLDKGTMDPRLNHSGMTEQDPAKRENTKNHACKDVGIYYEKPHYLYFLNFGLSF